MIENMILSGGGSADINYEHPTSITDNLVIRGTIVLSGIANKPYGVVCSKRFQPSSTWYHFYMVYIEDGDGNVLVNQAQVKASSTSSSQKSVAMSYDSTNQEVTLTITGLHYSLSLTASEIYCLYE